MKELPKPNYKDQLDVPEGYFDQLPGKISARINAAEQNKHRMLFQQTRSIAASFLLLALLGFGYLSLLSDQNAASKVEQVSLADLNQEEIDKYVVHTLAMDPDLLLIAFEQEPSTRQAVGEVEELLDGIEITDQEIDLLLEDPNLTF